MAESRASGARCPRIPSEARAPADSMAGGTHGSDSRCAGESPARANQPMEAGAVGSPTGVCELSGAVAWRWRRRSSHGPSERTPPFWPRCTGWPSPPRRMVAFGAMPGVSLRCPIFRRDARYFGASPAGEAPISKSRLPHLASSGFCLGLLRHFRGRNGWNSARVDRVPGRRGGCSPSQTLLPLTARQREQALEGAGSWRSRLLRPCSPNKLHRRDGARLERPSP
jgi:hypothetical protein